MSLDPIPDKVEDFKKLEKIIVCKIIIFKKIAIMHGKEDLQKSMEAFVISFTEAENTCNIMPRPVDSIRFIVLKLKRDLTYIDYVYFEPAHPNVM